MKPISLKRIGKSRSVAVVAALAFSQLLTGCLETRANQKEIEEKQVLRSTVANLQRSTADVNSRFQDIEEDVRRLDGRIEAVETLNKQAQARSDRGSVAIETKLRESDTVYREEFAKLTSEIEQLKAQVASMQQQQAAAAAAASSAASAKSSAADAKVPFAAGEEKFESRNWREAILDYEKYRKTYPTGKHFGEATYKIGVCFQEMGMTEEAKAFYEEVLAKFPKSKEAARAGARLRALKSGKR